MERKNTKRDKALIYNSLGFRILSFFTYDFLILLMTIVFPFLFGHKVVGRNNIKGHVRGIAVSNHCTYLDPGFIAKALHGKMVYFSILQKTVDIRGFGFFLRCLHGFPLPLNRPMDIASAVRFLLEKGRIVHFFPEGVLYDYNQQIKEFHTGPFYFALKNNVPVYPVTTVLKERRIFGKPLPRPWVKVITVIGPAVYPPLAYGDNRAAAESYAEAVRSTMQEVIDSQGGDKDLYKGKINHRI